MPEFCEVIRNRFPEYAKSGALSVVNLAASNSPGGISFYVDDRVSEWGATDQHWSERSKNFGVGAGRTLTIRAAKLADILKQHGIPRYCKIDIEGNDLEALASLSSSSQRGGTTLLHHLAPLRANALAVRRGGESLLIVRIAR
jgi:FkbM family methyltransferase